MTTWCKNLNRVFYKKTEIGEMDSIKYAHSVHSLTLENLKRVQEKEVDSLEHNKGVYKNLNGSKEYFDGRIEEIKKTLPVIDLFMKWENTHVHKDEHLDSVCLDV